MGPDILITHSSNIEAFIFMYKTNKSLNTQKAHFIFLMDSILKSIWEFSVRLVSPYSAVKGLKLNTSDTFVLFYCMKLFYSLIF